LAAKLIGRDPGRAQQEVEEIERISREALVQVREAVQGYRSAGLVEELDNARSALDAADIAVNFDVDDEATRAPAQVTNVIAMALREAVTNVIRHAGGTRCQISLGIVDKALELKVGDNGSGGAAIEGAGLSGMRERVESLAGSMQIDGSSGTSIKIRLPILVGPRTIAGGSVQDVA